MPTPPRLQVNESEGSPLSFDYNSFSPVKISLNRTLEDSPPKQSPYATPSQN